MNQAIVAKIRKLLRLAASGGPEGEIAQLRADELMGKHGLKVSLEDEEKQKRIIVENVAGENWRERLMDAVAKQYRCKFVINKRAATIGMIIGDEASARLAMGAYESLQQTIEQKCEASWNTIIRVIYDLAVPSVKELWLHIVKIFAVQGVVDRLRVPEPEPAAPVAETVPEPAAAEPEPAPSEPVVTQNAEPVAEPAEVEPEPEDDYDEVAPARPSDAPSADDVARIIERIGGMHVYMIKEAAISFGKSIAREMDVPLFTVDERREAKRNLKQIA